jgi:hypothetical protein
MGADSFLARTTGTIDLLKFSLVTLEAMGSGVSNPMGPHSKEQHLLCQDLELNLETLGRS